MKYVLRHQHLEFLPFTFYIYYYSLFNNNILEYLLHQPELNFTSPSVQLLN